jgi:hypothetical protein
MNKNNLSRVFEKSLILILMLSFAEGNLTIARAQAESQDTSITNMAGGHQGHPAPINHAPVNSSPAGTTPDSNPAAATNPAGPVTTTGVGGVTGTGPGPSATPGNGNNPVTGNSGATASNPPANNPTNNNPAHGTTGGSDVSTSNPPTTTTTTVGNGTNSPAPGNGSSSVTNHNGKATTQPVTQNPGNTVPSGPVGVITPPPHPAPVTNPVNTVSTNGKSTTRPVTPNGNNNGTNSGPVSISIPGGKSNTRAVTASGNNTNSGPVGAIAPASANTTASNGSTDPLTGTTTFSAVPNARTSGGTAPAQNSMGNPSGVTTVKTIPIDNAEGASGLRTPSGSTNAVDSASTGSGKAVILPTSIPPLKKPTTTTTTTTTPPATSTSPTTGGTASGGTAGGGATGGGAVNPGAGGNTASNPVTPNSCEDKALKTVYDLLIADNHNAIGIMFELTAMRLAKRALDQKPTASTLEDLTSGNIKALKDQLNTADPDHKMADAIQTAYQTFGEPGDLRTVDERFGQDGAAAVKRAKNACYFDQTTTRRFRNDETSAYIMAVTVGEPDSGLTDMDAATVWVVERARKEAEKRDPAHYAIGKADGNLLNISTRVARYLGRILGGRNVTSDEMASMIAAQEQSLNGIIAGAYAQVKVSLQACLSTECVDCNTAQTRFNKFDSDNAGIDKLQRGLLETISRSDNLKIEKDLKGKMGETVFDFSNFANAKDKSSSEAGIPSRPPRGLHDVCGNTLRKHHKGTTTVVAKPPVTTPPVDPVTVGNPTTTADPTTPVTPVTPPVTTVSNPAKPTKHGKKTKPTTPVTPVTPTTPNPPVDPVTVGNPTNTTDPTNVTTTPISPGHPRTDPIIRGSGPAPAALPQEKSSDASPATQAIVFNKSFAEFSQQLRANQVSETGPCSARIATVQGKTVVIATNGNTKQTIDNTPDALQTFYQQCTK